MFQKILLVKDKMWSGNMALQSMMNQEKLSATIAIWSIPVMLLF
jgi:hypothetical protein